MHLGCIQFGSGVRGEVLATVFRVRDHGPPLTGWGFSKHLLPRLWIKPHGFRTWTGLSPKALPKHYRRHPGFNFDAQPHVILSLPLPFKSHQPVRRGPQPFSKIAGRKRTMSNSTRSQATAVGAFWLLTMTIRANPKPSFAPGRIQIIRQITTGSKASSADDVSRCRCVVANIAHMRNARWSGNCSLELCSRTNRSFRPFFS